MKPEQHQIVFHNNIKASVHSIEELHSKSMNNWQGWWCSAGIRHLNISFDGIVYKGTCREGGPLGSIYDRSMANGSIKLLEWILCNKNSCSCGPDMRATKVLNKSDIAMVTSDKMTSPDFDALEQVDLVTDPTVVYCGLYSEHKQVIWEIGRRCNYDCWYCNPGIHNNYESQKSLGSLLHAYHHLMRIWGKKDKIKFTFAGGESTFNPDYLEFVQYLRSQGHIIHTTTNGSHTANYYSQLMLVSDISFSAHLSYLETPNIMKKFVANIAAAQASKISTPSTNKHILEVRIMLQPGKLELAMNLYTTLKEIINNVTVDLLRDREGKIIPYSKEELDWAMGAIDIAKQPLPELRK